MLLRLALDFMLSAFRDARASVRFFRLALKASHNQEPNGKASRQGAGDPRLERSFSPRVINVDKNAAYPPAIDSLTKDQTLTKTTELRRVKYLNNIVELFASIHQTIGQPRDGMRVRSTPRGEP